MSTKREKNECEAADYETAILATEYGRFNNALMIMTIPCGLANIFVTTSLSLALPSAQCDLNLTIFDKGLLNSAIYIGMISLAFLWGYLADTYGRQKLLIYGYLINSICDLAIVFTHRMWYLMLFKVLGGFIMSGPHAIIMSFVSEFHGKKHRDRVMINIGQSFNLGQIFLPLLAYFVLPNQWHIIIVKNVLEFKTWQIFFLICSLPSILSLIFVCYFPESPKFLMSRGRNVEAMAVFRKVYRINTGRPESEYPIKSLINELDVKLSIPSNNSQSLPVTKPNKTGWIQFLPLFQKPHLHKVCLVFTIQFLLLLGLNAFRLWLPQIFAIFTEYEDSVAVGNFTAKNASLCSLIEADVLKSNMIYDEQSNDVECNAIFSGGNYMQSVYVGISIVSLFFVVAHVVKYAGNRLILIFSMLLCGICALVFYWVKSSLVTLILGAIYVSFEAVCSAALISVTVTIFPTSLRTMAISLGMMVGRTGSFLGNVFVPLLLNYGCFPPFLLLGVVSILGGLLSILLPETKSKPLL